MTRAVVLRCGIPLLLLTAGCSSSGMMETMDRGIELEIAGRKLERGGEHAGAVAKYSAALKDFQRSLEIAKDRKNRVFQSFLLAKLSIVESGQGRCLQHDNNPQGSWEQAIERYRASGLWAVEGQFLKMKENAISSEAFCLRPDKNPKGSWKRAATSYGQVVKLAKTFGDDEGRGIALRNQAFCLWRATSRRS